MATALTYAVKPVIPRAIVAAGAASIVAVLNLAFFIERGAVPIAALVLVAVSLVLLGLAAWRFRTEEREAGTTDSGSRA